MSTLNDRDRYPLNDDLERRLDAAEPAWVRRFTKPEPAQPSRRNRQLETALALMVLLTLFGLLLGIPGVVVVCTAAAIVLFRIRFLPSRIQRDRNSATEGSRHQGPSGRPHTGSEPRSPSDREYHDDH